jgi:hypothetical protein
MAPSDYEQGVVCRQKTQIASVWPRQPRNAGEEATSFRRRCASSGSRRLGMYQGEYCEPLFEFATHFFMICPRSSPPGCAQYGYSRSSNGQNRTAIHTPGGRGAGAPRHHFPSPVAATATPVPSAAEQQQDDDYNQEQLHRHGNLRSGICVRPCCFKSRPHGGNVRARVKRCLTKIAHLRSTTSNR